MILQSAAGTVVGLMFGGIILLYLHYKDKQGE